MYSRNTNRQKDKATSPIQPRQASSSDNGLGNSSPTSESFNELDFPITHRKKIRSCATKHPISQFVSYSRLSPQYRAFVSKLASISIPNHIQDAFMDPKWKQAMLEEMNVLHKLGNWLNYLEVKRWLGVYSKT